MGNMVKVRVIKPARFAPYNLAAGVGEVTHVDRSNLPALLAGGIVQVIEEEKKAEKATSAKAGKAKKAVKK